jgi:TusA-related sulfurtransferase
MITLDCLGDICPVPVMRLRVALQGLPANGEVLLITDHSCVPESVKDFCRSGKLAFSADEVINGVWELRVSRPGSPPSGAH